MVTELVAGNKDGSKDLPVNNWKILSLHGHVIPIHIKAQQNSLDDLHQFLSVPKDHK
jgi:hypothetical protein